MRMKVDLNCPVELFSYELPTADFEAVSLLLFNLAEKTVASVQVTLILYDMENELISRHMERVMDLNGQSKATFVVDVPLSAEDVPPATIEVVIEKVWFSDSFVWRRSNTALSEYELEPVTQSKALEMLKFLAGADALCYPREDKHLWICVCGRANPLMEPACRRCGRTHDDVLRNYNQQTIEAVSDQREKELEEKALHARKTASDMQMEREDTFLKKKKRTKTTVVIAASAAGLVLAGYGTVFHLLPYLRYRDANKLLLSGAYDDAKAAFVQMADYRDAKTLALKSDYEKALALMDEKTDVSFMDAQAVFESLGDYADAADLALEARYLLAENRVEAGSLIDAAEIYEALFGYKESAAKAKAARYRDANNKMDAKSYDEARQAFLNLNDYEDAAKLADECLYLPAVSALTLKNYDSAIALFKALGDYKDAEELLSKTYFEKGESLYSLGNFQEAGEYYLLADDYEGASDKAGLCLYEYADTLLTQKDYQKAYELFSQLGDYEKSKEKALESGLALAALALEDQSWGAAEKVLAPLMDEADAKAMMDEMHYQQALVLLKDSDFAAARDQFTALGTYQDSVQKAQEAVYHLAEQAVIVGKYDEAIALYQGIASYGDAEDRAHDAAYEYAQALVTDGDDDKVVALLEGIPGEKYADLVAQSRYRLAKAAMDLKDYQTALTHLEALEAYSMLKDYPDAAALLKAGRFNLAQEKMDAGDMIGAAKLYTLAGDYSGAAKKAEEAYQSYYGAVAQSAQDAFDAGDYPGVIALLAGLDMNNVPKAFKGMLENYNEANYRLANDLYNQGQPYQALPYYRSIPDYKDVTSAKLSRNAYRILGQWQNAGGMTMVFNDDGTCVIGDETLYFTVRNYIMSTGTSPDNLSATHRVSRLTATDLTLRDMRGKDIITYRMNRVKE